MSYSYGKSIVTDGLVFYVDAANENSYPGTGTTWKNLIGGNDGTFSATPTTDSANGGSIVFDGVDDYVSGTGLPIGGGSGTSQSFSIWFKGDSFATSAFSNGLFFWNIFEGVGVRSDGEIYIQTSGDNSSGDFSPTPTATINTWHNAAFNFNQGVSYEIWLDGVSFGSVVTSDTSSAPNSSQIWSIGSRIWTSSNLEGYFNGNIATVQAYNRALSSDEITQNYNALKNRFV